MRFPALVSFCLAALQSKSSQDLYQALIRSLAAPLFSQIILQAYQQSSRP